MKRLSNQLYFICKITATEEIAHFIIWYPSHKMFCEKDLTKFNAKKVKNVDTPYRHLLFLTIRLREPSHFPFWIGFQEAEMLFYFYICLKFYLRKSKKKKKNCIEPTYHSGVKAKWKHFKQKANKSHKETPRQITRLVPFPFCCLLPKLGFGYKK